MSSPRVSVIIVNWNRWNDIKTNLDRLQKVDYPEKEIIVVDNGSTDGSVEELSKLSWVKSILLSDNAGPAHARNAGIDAATGQYVFFLDSDAFLTPESLTKLVARMEIDPDLGVIGCQVLDAATRKIDPWIYPQSCRTHGQQEFETYSFPATGAMVRKAALERAGAFWEDLFIYNEEVDLSIRIIRAGYRIIYFPHVQVYHSPSDRGRVPSNTYWYYQIRNWIWIFYRYYPGRHRWRKVLLYIMVYLIKGVASLRLWGCLRGILAGVKATDIIRRYPNKLTRDELGLLGKLNPRWMIRLGR